MVVVQVNHAHISVTAAVVRNIFQSGFKFFVPSRFRTSTHAKLLAK